jgi:hypothetical protein
MKSTSIRFCIAMIVCAVFLSILAMPAAADTAIAIVKSLSGPAVHMRNFGETEYLLRVGLRLPSGTVIRTEEGTELSLNLPDSHNVRLGPAATTVRWNAGRLTTISLTLYRGQTNHRVDRLGSNASYRVITPVAVVGVRGTEFSVAAGENGAARTKVKSGEVMTGLDDAERPLGAGEEDVAAFDGGGVSAEEDADWLEQQKVRDSETAAAIEAAAAARMESVNRMTIEDLAEMAVLSRDILSFARRRPSDLGDIADAAEIFARGIEVYRRMEARREGMEARRVLARDLARSHGVSDAEADGQYERYSATRESKASGIESFIGGLEKLSTLIRAARAIPAVPTGGGGFLRRVPMPF